jgi:hypothetical protein
MHGLQWDYSLIPATTRDLQIFIFKKSASKLSNTQRIDFHYYNIFIKCLSTLSVDAELNSISKKTFTLYDQNFSNTKHVRYS